VIALPNYLLELNLPHDISPSCGAEDARRVQAASVPGAGELRYVRTVFVAEEATCFHLFEAPSRNAVVEAAARAGLADARVTEAVLNEELPTPQRRFQ
jgi:hypothetical protein